MNPKTVGDIFFAALGWLGRVVSVSVVRVLSAAILPAFVKATSMVLVPRWVRGRGLVIIEP